VDNPGLESREVQEMFRLSVKFRLTVGSLLSPIQMAPWIFFGGKAAEA